MVKLNILKFIQITIIHNNMITKVYTADVKINKNYKNYRKYIILYNEHGYLLIDYELFVISTYDLDDFDIINKKHIMDISI